MAMSWKWTIYNCFLCYCTIVSSNPMFDSDPIQPRKSDLTAFENDRNLLAKVYLTEKMRQILL